MSTHSPLLGDTARLYAALGEGARRVWQGDPVRPSTTTSAVPLTTPPKLTALAAFGEHCLTASLADAAWRHSMHMESDRQWVQRLLDDAGVAVAFTKGALADPLFWRNSGLRGGTDLDVVVRRVDFEAVHHILCSHGWGLRRGHQLPTPQVTKSEWQYQWQSADAAHFDVDVHIEFGATPPYAPFGEAALCRRRRNDIGDVWGLRPEDWLASLAINTASQKFNGCLTAALDVYALCHHHPEAVDEGVQLAKQVGAEWGLWGLYRLVTSGFGGRWPTSVPQVSLSTSQRRIIDEVVGLRDGVDRLSSGWRRALLVDAPLLGPVAVARRLQSKLRQHWPGRPRR